ncbi:histone-like nucleoid-structuring protein Lsr2 [Streptomyces sp. 900105245]
MTQKRVTIFVDDITGEETPEGATHTFTLNGVTYEIDLSPDSYDQMLESFSPYLAAGRKVGRSKRSGKSDDGRADGPSTAEIRAWAKANGYDVNDRGRIPSEIRVAFEGAQ